MPVEGDAVAIYRLLQNSAFGPEDIERLSAAYEEALRLLQLSDRTDAATQIIARRIIQAAQSGVSSHRRFAGSRTSAFRDGRPVTAW